MIGRPRRRFRRDSSAPSVRALRAVGLRPGDIAIDAGANVGTMTAAMAESGATVCAFEPNVREDRFVEIEVIDLDAFVRSLDGRVRVLKPDVEGAECRILRRMLATGTLREIDHVFVETHDAKIPSLRAETNVLSRALEEERLDRV